MDNFNVLSRIISIIIGSAVVWLIGSFISWNLTWFIDSFGGRLIAIIVFLIIIAANFYEND